MGEFIYTKVNPKNYDYVLTNLIKDIKKRGIRYPIVGEMVNNKIHGLNVGGKRWMVATALEYDEIPAIFYSRYDNKTGLEGTPVRSTGDLIDLFGEDVKNHDTYKILQHQMKVHAT